MKKLLLLLLFSSFCFAQTLDPVLNKSYPVTAATTLTSENVAVRGIRYYRLRFVSTGATKPDNCDVQIQISSDNFTRNITNYGSFPCNIDGETLPFLISTAYIRLNVDSYIANSANNITNINLLGYVNKPN